MECGAAGGAGVDDDQAVPTDVNAALESPLRVADDAIRHRARLVEDPGRHSSAPRLRKPLDLARLETLVEEALARDRNGRG